MQVPVVSTNVGDLGILFSNYKYGPVFLVHDHVALASELDSIVTQPENLHIRALTGRKIAEQELDITICVAGQTEFYKRVLST